MTAYAKVDTPNTQIHDRLRQGRYP
jgi:hypothetical protein